MLTPRGRFTYGQDIRASQVAAFLSGVPYRVEIVANLDAYLAGGEPYQRLTLTGADIKSRLTPRLYEIPLSGLEGRVRIAAPDHAQEEAGPDAGMLDWPNTGPGPGMVSADGSVFEWPTTTRPPIPSSDLRASDVPGEDADWGEIEWFAASFNGYDHYGDLERLAPVANITRDYYSRLGFLPPDADLDSLRSALFFEHRRFHHFGHAPGAADVPYLRALLNEIRNRLDLEN